MIISRKDFAEKVSAAGVDRNYDALVKYGLSISTHLVNLLWKKKEIAAITHHASAPIIDCDLHLNSHCLRNMSETSHVTASRERNVVGEAVSVRPAANLPSTSTCVQWRRPFHARDQKRLTGRVKEPKRQHINKRPRVDHPAVVDRQDGPVSRSLPQRKWMDTIEHQQA